MLIYPVLLTAKEVVFNWRGAVDRDAILEKLGALAKVALRVNCDNKDDSSGKGIVCTFVYGDDLVLLMTPAKLSSTCIFGHLHIIFRDWNYSGSTESVWQRILGEEELPSFPGTLNKTQLGEPK